MAQIRKKEGKETPAISTASLPDIIFILLFFFMVVTVLRETELKVDVKLPEASELSKLENKSLVRYIYIGKPKTEYQSKFGTAPMVQLDDKLAKPNQVPAFVEQSRLSIEEPMRLGMTMALRVDEDVKMGIVSDVKQELRKADALKINYSAIAKGEE